jgi:hypothetical protein
VVADRHAGEVAEFFVHSQGFAVPVFRLVQPSPLPGCVAELGVSGRYVGAVTEFFLDGEGFAVPIFRLVRPSAKVGGVAEPTVNDGDVAAGPFGFGLVL